MASVNVTFDFNKGVATLTGLEKTVETTCDASITTLSHYKMRIIEYQLEDDAKWVFVWEQYGTWEQFFSFKQYLPWKMSRPKPTSYNPWSVLASWSYIAKPSKGTLQTNTIYRNSYNYQQFPEIKNIEFKVIGTQDMDWDTINATDGYWY